MFDLKHDKKHDCRMENGKEICGQKTSREFSFGASRSSSQFIFGGIIGWWVVLSLVSFFLGWGSGGFDEGIKWGGYTFAMCLAFIGFLIPGFGIYMIFTFSSISSGFMGLVGIASNFWIDAINGLFLVGGIIGQVLIIIAIVLAVIFIPRIFR